MTTTRKREPRRDLACSECGSMFTPTKPQWDIRRRGRSFCSRECRAVGQRRSSKEWWDANPLTNTVTRPTRACAVCGAGFTISAKQHHNMRKDPEANLYCTRECFHTIHRHAETRAHAIAWMRKHPEVGGLKAARALNIPYHTLIVWRKDEGMPCNKVTRRGAKTCTHCGEEYWPSRAQWHSREKYKAQVCSDKCRRGALSARTLGVPRPDLRKHGLYSLEMYQVRRVRKAIDNFIKNGANQ